MSSFLIGRIRTDSYSVKFPIAQPAASISLHWHLLYKSSQDFIFLYGHYEIINKVYFLYTDVLLSVKSLHQHIFLMNFTREALR